MSALPPCALALRPSAASPSPRAPQVSRAPQFPLPRSQPQPFSARPPVPLPLGRGPVALGLLPTSSQSTGAALCRTTGLSVSSRHAPWAPSAPPDTLTQAARPAPGSGQRNPSAEADMGAKSRGGSAHPGSKGGGKEGEMGEGEEEGSSNSTFPAERGAKEGQGRAAPLGQRGGRGGVKRGEGSGPPLVEGGEEGGGGGRRGGLAPRGPSGRALAGGGRAAAPPAGEGAGRGHREGGQGERWPSRPWQRLRKWRPRRRAASGPGQCLVHRKPPGGVESPDDPATMRPQLGATEAGRRGAKGGGCGACFRGM